MPHTLPTVSWKTCLLAAGLLMLASALLWGLAAFYPLLRDREAGPFFGMDLAMAGRWLACGAATLALSLTRQPE